MIDIRFYRIYDIGKEIDLDWLERALSQNYFTARTSFLRVKPKSIMVEAPPLLIRMQPFQVEREGRSYELGVVAKVYDIGVISFCFVHEDPDADLKSISQKPIFAGQKGLSEYFGQYLRTLGEIIKPHIRGYATDPDFFEDYTLYITDRRDDSVDLVPVLMGESIKVSPQMREEITRNSLSYTTDDLAVLSWDSGIICDPESPADILDLIEFANVQVLELRYYDRELTRQMHKMYEDIERADQLSWIRRLHTYHSIMGSLMETNAEISEITEKVKNLIKVTEDVYYARVYETALKVFRSGQWSESVSRKIEVIRDNYSMLSDEVHIQHSNFLEWVIIILITLEFGLAIWQSFS
ncbi:MAG: hypothetical protein LUQ25_09595 [Methanoregulaceae archaeon]|nr:hypothetical protein [Methanoregulaceae archaeon]